MAIIMMDFGNHYKQIDHATRAWAKVGSVDFVIRKSDEKKIDGIQVRNKICLNDRFFAFKAILYVVFMRVKYTRVVFLTGPEYFYGVTGVINKLLWFLSVLVFFNKNIIYVKNSDVYMESFLIKNSLRFSEFIFFESVQQKKYFEDNIMNLGVKYKTSYVYYSDCINRNAKRRSQSSMITIGLIGQFDVKRRDYTSLLDGLEKNYFPDARFIQVGRVCKGDKNNEFFKKLKSYISFPKEDFTTKELDEYLLECDVLLSMNNKSMGYGEGKGTAAYGESISVKKPLIMPSFLSGNKEFSDFTFYYEDASSLRDAIKDAIYFVKDEKRTNEVFGRYSLNIVSQIFATH